MMQRLLVRGPSCLRWLVLGWLVAGCTVPPRTAIPSRSLLGVTRVACVGDSITAGSGLPDPARQAYPAVLGTLLGGAYEVRNFGVSGATLLRFGDHPYLDSDAFNAARYFRPHVVVIVLGTNDSKPHNWRDAAALERDTCTLVRAFLSLPSQPTVYLCAPPPVFQDRWGITAGTVHSQLTPRLRLLAARQGWPWIDLYGALRGQDEVFPDGIHPDAAGAVQIAERIEAGLRGL